MKIQSMIAIFALFWVMSGFLVLPFGVQTHEEVGAERVPGQADSAPHDFQIKRVLLRTTALAALFFILFILNYQYEWIKGPETGF